MFFPDGTAFSVFVPFVGPQLFRRGYRFFSSERLERATIPLRQSGLWEWGPSGDRAEFETARVEPILDPGPHPDFAVHADDPDGDFVRFEAASYGHARNHLDRPVLRGLLETHWSYNEYLFRVEGLEGRIGGRDLGEGSLGEGFGTLEYAWGLGL